MDPLMMLLGGVLTGAGLLFLWAGSVRLTQPGVRYAIPLFVCGLVLLVVGVALAGGLLTGLLVGGA